jgi:tight adherence protein C
MPFHVVAAAGAVMLSIPLLYWALASDRRSERAQRNLASYAVEQARSNHLDRSLVERVASRTEGGLSRLARRLSPSGTADALARRIHLAGKADRWTVERVFGIKMLLAVGLFLLGTLRALAIERPGQIGLAAVFALGGFLLPDVLLVNKAKRRQEDIRYDLPDTIDQLLISVEAGLSFDAALARVARTGRGPFADELQRVVQDVGLGMSRVAALEDLLDRTDVSELREFVLALKQADMHGLSIGRILRVQSEELREKRKQRAEEKAHKIPVKMTIPLVLCILPTLVLVIVAPAFIDLAETL